MHKFSETQLMEGKTWIWDCGKDQPLNLMLLRHAADLSTSCYCCSSEGSNREIKGESK